MESLFGPQDRVDLWFSDYVIPKIRGPQGRHENLSRGSETWRAMQAQNCDVVDYLVKTSG